MALTLSVTLWKSEFWMLNTQVESLLDTIAGLPVHPLVVHFAVVLLPLAAFSLMISIYIPRYRKSYAFASLVGVFLGTGAAVVAKQSGEALAARIGNPATHANYGNILPLVSALFFAISLLWYRTIRKSSNIKATPLGHVTALVGIAVLVLTFLTGHTGAEAVWKGRLPAKSSSSTSTTTPAKVDKTYSAAEVAKHVTGKSCWTIINSGVYDLTKWINQHPGGPAVIEAICGKNGTAAFNGQHLGQQRPENILASYKIGKIG